MRQARLVKTQTMTTEDEIDRQTGLLRWDESSWQDSVPAGTVFLRVDLRGFRKVNHEIGMAAGDAVLAEAGRRLREIIAPGQGYRVGGDEFLVVARLPDEAAIRRLAASFRTSLERLHHGLVVGTTMAAARAFLGMTGAQLRQHADWGISALRAPEDPFLVLIPPEAGEVEARRGSPVELAPGEANGGVTNRS